MFSRRIKNTLLSFAKFPVVGIFGPRQSGKTTLAREVFPRHTYLNFEDPQIRIFAEENPRAFLQEFENPYGLILDEFQYVPQMLSYIQLVSDEKNRPGYFVLTGSQNFLMNQAVTQSLAGRIGILTLLPFSLAELSDNVLLGETSYETIFKGSYPRIYSQEIAPAELYPSYIQSYIERDVRLLVNIENMATFQRFMSLCAALSGQELNVSSLATSCGISQKTVVSWLSILQASYIVFLLQPYYKNFNKRVIKSPKLYFYDTGVVCSLLNIRSSQELALSSFRGPLFESLIIADFYKQYCNRGLKSPLYYWRDMNGRLEVDCIIDTGVSCIPIEIKSSETITKAHYASILKFDEIAEIDPAGNYLIYNGIYNQKAGNGTAVSWQSAGSLIEQIEENFLKK